MYNKLNVLYVVYGDRRIGEQWIGNVGECRDGPKSERTHFAIASPASF